MDDQMVYITNLEYYRSLFKIKSRIPFFDRRNVFFLERALVERMAVFPDCFFKGLYFVVIYQHPYLI